MTAFEKTGWIVFALAWAVLILSVTNPVIGFRIMLIGGVWAMMLIATWGEWK